ncbi:hypothetical protein OsccyDRAFT_2239 [Leptolyngbyaceae cyanobacterium JSC-12]|nr:hypothetical protein OsccyDRAFT_2239 [Leptolyngbyaceae cyanobacterium JSC-12]
MSDAIASAIRTSQALADKIKTVATTTGDSISPVLYEFVEQGTETVGRVVTPIAENSFVKFATSIPVIRWLFAALGQVNVEMVKKDVAELQRQYPADTPQQLAHRVMMDTAWKAAGIGLATNFIPPLALTLFAIDLGAISALQAEMIYRIAVIYGFSPNEPARRGEVLTLWGLFTASSEVMKIGLSIVELLPSVGTLVGTSSSAALVYGMGYLACRFYEEKLKSTGFQGRQLNG